MSSEEKNEHLQLSDEEVLVRACELLKVRLNKLTLPDGELKSADSVTSRMILAVLASREKAVFEMLRVFLAELKKQPDFDRMDNKVELLLRMFRSFLRSETPDIEKLLSKEQMKEDDVKHLKYSADTKHEPTSPYIRLNTVIGISTFVLLLIIVSIGGVLVHNANEKARKFEDEYDQIRRKFSPFIEALSPENGSKPVSKKEEVKIVPLPEEKKLEVQKFYEHMEERLQLPSAIDFIKTYTDHYDSEKDTYDEKALRAAILKLILDMEGNRTIFVTALEKSVHEKVENAQIDTFIELLGREIILPSPSELLKIYSNQSTHDEKRRKIINALIQLSENKKLIDEYLGKLFSK